VTTLASRTAKATDEIAAQIARIQSETGSAVERQNAATAEIARNVQQAATSNHMVTNKVSELRAAQSRQAATRMAETIGQLSQRAESLTGQISSFRRKAYRLESGDVLRPGWSQIHHNPGLPAMLRIRHFSENGAVAPASKDRASDE
jgi:hypothetical protein